MRSWSLSDLALARPVTVGMTLIAVFLLGVIAVFQLPLAFLPTGSGSRVRIRADITRTSPEVLEREVIRPLEEAVAGVRDLTRLRASSGAWGARLDLEFRPGTDIDARKLELRERVDRVRGDLPEIVQRVELTSSHGDADEPVMQVRIASDKDLGREYYLIEQRVVRAIERIEGVARVDLGGVEPHELEVAVDLDAVRGNGLELAEVGGAVRSARQARSLGLLRRSTANTGVRSPGLPADPDRFANLPIERGTGASAAFSSTPAAAEGDLSATFSADPPAFARLGEVAEVALHPIEQRRGSRLNGRKAINLDVFADAGASPVEVSAELREVIEELRGDPTLGGIDVMVFQDQGEVVLDTLGDLRDTGIFGGLIGILILFGFLHQWRTTLTASICIPLSVLAACGVLFLRGEELNCIVLLGLVLGVGMLIDNAVVIVESIQIQLQRGRPPHEAALRGAREVGLATVASTMSSVIVFLPMIVGGGPSNLYTYLKPLGATFVTALIASLLISQTVVPLVMGRVVKVAPKPTKNRLLEPIAAAYARLIGKTIERPRLTLFVGLLLAASVALPITQMNVDMGKDEKLVAMPIRLEMTGSSDFRRVEGHIAALEEALLEDQDEIGFKTLTCRFRDWGGTCDAFPAIDIESEQQLSDFKQRLTEALPEQAGVKYHVGERDGWWRGGRDAREIHFVLRGEDMGVLIELSERYAEHLAANMPKGDADDPDAGGYDTITGPYNEGNQELHIRLDGDRLRRLGLRANDVAQMVSLAFQGVPLGTVQGRDGEVDLRLSTGRLGGALGDAGASATDGPGLAELEDLRIPTANGTEVPLASLGVIELERSPWWVQRVDRQTEVRLRVRFFSVDAKANKAALEQAQAGFVMPQGYSAGEGTRWWGGDRDEMIELLINLGLCLILVYAVMASLFESFLKPFAILITGLLGCFGAPWALWLTGTTFDIVAVIGLFILVGIIVNNGIMLIDKVTQLRAQGIERGEALRQGGRDRLRPVLMTAATTIFGLVPMLIHHPTMAGIYYHAIALIIAAGLATSTLMTLVFLPSAYVVVENFALASGRVWRFIAGRKSAS